MGVYLMGMYLTGRTPYGCVSWGVGLLGVHLTGHVPHWRMSYGRAPHWVCISLNVT
jgi:hypothetical protein